MSREVQISRGMFAVVDDEDYALVSQFRWFAMPGRHTFYASRSWWVPERGKSTSQPMHVMLTGFARADHIDGDGLNNRRENLRDASVQQNRRNSQKGRVGTSRFKGVKLQEGRYWIANIGVSPGVQKYLGCFSNEADAARAYDSAASDLFGEFARLNFPAVAR